MPIPIARPPSDMMLSETSRMFRGANVTNIEIGILTAMIAVVRMSLKKPSKTIMARTPPKIAVFLTSLMLLSMKIERSATTRKYASSSARSLPAKVERLDPEISPTSSFTNLATSTMLASASL